MACLALPDPRRETTTVARAFFLNNAADQPHAGAVQAAFPYPLAARQAEVEADVELEIVSERTDGFSPHAHFPTRYGLEQAAARGVLAYQFSPPGAPVIQ